MEDINKEARDNAKEYTDFFSAFLDEARDDSRVVNGDDWRVEDKIKRFGRVMESINDAKITKRRTVEDYDQKRSTIKVRAYKEDDQLTAEAFQGLIYQIHNDSMGEAVKDLAMSDMLDTGMGFYKWSTEYEERSFNQKIKLKPIYDNFNVFLDIMNTKEIDGSDIMWGGELIHYSKDTYEKLYPDASTKSFPFDGAEIQNDKIAVCEYYRVKMVNDTLIAIYNPIFDNVLTLYVTDLKDKYKEVYRYFVDEAGYNEEQDLFEWLNETGRILADRDVERRRVEWYILNHDEILDKGIVGGDYIPIVPMLGARYRIGSDVYFDSLIRQSKQPTRLNNLVLSNYVEVMSADPIAPFVSDWRKIKNHMPIWANANNIAQSVMPFDPVINDDGTVDATPPQRMMKGDVPTGWAEVFRMTAEAKTRTSGLPDSALGMQGNEVAASAIQSRTENGLANRSIFFKSRHFSDQLLGKHLEKAIPVYYDTDMLIDVADIEGKTYSARINRENHKEGTGKFKGKKIDFVNAKLSTYITVGASYNSLKQETTDKILSILPMTPEPYLSVIYPRFLKNLDIVDAQEMYDDAMKVAPPEIREQEGDKTPQQLNSELQQAQQQIQQLTQMNEELNKVIMGEEQRVKSQENIAKLRAQTDLVIEDRKQKGSLERDLLSHRTDIKTTEMEIQARKELEILKQSMANMSSKMDMIVTALTNRKESETKDD